ncbi:MAG: AAA family ATPase [Spirochaetaceae bacterium]|jgi:MoxR-like ATPase|nr:AAA family ATPase [Spirochaetaceae bacterium]
MDTQSRIPVDREKCALALEAARSEIARRVVGQAPVVNGILTALITGGHVLLEGVPGLAKTLLVKTLADISGLDFKRIQFTPDLLPADVTGTLIYQQAAGQFTVHYGPVFTNLMLADEINRAPAKVQSALLEAMAERQVTIGNDTYPLPKPFFVLATQNPIEQEGTYGLPEAQLDRFLLKLMVPYPAAAEEAAIVRAGGEPEKIPLKVVFPQEVISQCRNALESINCDDKIIQYIVSIMTATRPGAGEQAAGRGRAARPRGGDDLLRYIAFGASPRASIALYRTAKVRALFEGRAFVLPEDVKRAASDTLRHRLVLSYEAAADGITADDLIAKILAVLPVP